MAERQYFALRYAIPGYAFILILIGFNYVPLFNIMATAVSDIFGAFLAFLSLFSGAAIGFLISQLWWWRWQKKFGILGCTGYDESITAFCKKYGLIKPENDEKKKRVFLTAVDYVSHSKVDKDTLILAERRWDMYYILSSSIYALCLSLAFGIAFRLYFQLFFMEPPFLSIPKPLEAWAEPVVLVIIIVVVGILIFLLQRGRQWILSLSTALHEARMRTSGVSTEDLRIAFPSLFPEKKDS